jgi:hypothetical protein
MSILGKIFSRVWDRAKAGPGGRSAPAAPAEKPQTAPAPTPAPQTPPPASPTASDWSTSPWPTLSEAELIQTLDDLNAQRSDRLNWQTSIVDLMKLVGLESSLAERRELADELGYMGDKSDSAAMNIWLHKQVMDRLKANRGQPTADLK